MLWSHNWEEAKNRITYTYCLQKKPWKLNHLKFSKRNFSCFPVKSLDWFWLLRPLYYVRSEDKATEIYVSFVVPFLSVAKRKHLNLQKYLQVIMEGHLLQFLSEKTITFPLTKIVHFTNFTGILFHCFSFSSKIYPIPSFLQAVVVVVVIFIIIIIFNFLPCHVLSHHILSFSLVEQSTK